ncbi:MAG: glycoside hydrolase family 13 protein [Sphaerochaeta sp.]|nr:glycoside hydrolase family 13 protein [Sphaerochaeta sp.]
MQEPWMQMIDSSVSSPYIQPLFPKKGETVKIGIQVPNKTPVGKVLLVWYGFGSQHTLACSEARGIRHAEITIEEHSTSWYFVLVCPDRAYYYSKLGVTASVPSLLDSFSLLSDIQPVRYVPSGTCYQIFPDRFRKGDDSIGAIENQYSFDGGSVSVHSFDEKPLPFEEGRCLDFFNGDLKGIEDAIPHLKNLGVTVVYVNPIGVSKTTHRYDCCDFFHIDEKLGGDAAFANLCNKLHENDIRIIVDISINHTGAEHPWLKKALDDDSCEEASFYYKKEDGSIACWQDVPTLPQLNYTSEKLRNVMYRNPSSVMRMFLQSPYLQDGWRLDVANEVGRRGKDQLCEEIWREVRQAVKSENDQAYLVGENWIDASPFLQGDMWDGTMNYLGSSRPLRSWLGETDRFLTSGWGHDPENTRAFTAEELGQALMSQLNALPAQMACMQMNLIDSHDTPRLHANGKIFSWNLYEGCVQLLYLLPGMPSVYYGDEVGLQGPYGSVEAARYPMEWEKSKWDKRFYTLYVSLGKMRKTYAELLAFGAWKIIHADTNTFVFVRYDADLALLCVLNKEKNDALIQIPNTMLHIDALLEEQSGCEVSEKHLTLRLKGEQSLLLACRRSKDF